MSVTNSNSNVTEGKSGFGDFLSRWKRKVLSKDADEQTPLASNKGDTSCANREKAGSDWSAEDAECMIIDSELNQGSRRVENRGEDSSGCEELYQSRADKDDTGVADASRIDRHRPSPHDKSNVTDPVSECHSNASSHGSTCNCEDCREDVERVSIAENLKSTLVDTESKSPSSILSSSSPSVPPVSVRGGKTPAMPFKPQLPSVLRNRYGQEGRNSAQTGRTAVSSKADEEWAEVSSLDEVSMASSQPDAASSSTEDSTSRIYQGKSPSKSSLEEHSSGDAGLSRETDVMQSPSSGWSGDQRRVYEMQLENLQEQLVDIMIENQTLAQKLQRYDNSDIIPLLKKLEEERDKNGTLTQRCLAMEECLKTSRPLRQVSVDAEEARVDGLGETSSVLEGLDGPPPTRWERVQNYVMERVFTIMSDFTEEGEEKEPEASEEGDELTVKKLKENLKRFKTGYEPGMLFCKAVAALVSWKSSSNTFLAFIIYMYAVWRGWSTTLVLGLMIWYLSTTYFISRGWTIQFSFLPYHLVDVTPDEGPPLSMSDRFQLVLHVSRKVQNLLGHLADQMEKIHNFVYWTNPELTRKLFINLVIAFTASLFVSGATLLTVIGLFLGVKIFLMNPVLKKYPRLKAKYSFEQKVFREVPTNAELEQRRAIQETEQFLVPDIEGITIRLAAEASHDPKPASKRWRAFSQIFSLPESEQPLPGWKDGKHCALISKNTVSGAFKNGRLYLTKSFLCFEKSKLIKEGNMMIPLKDITRIGKAKPFSFIPGSGMSIEIHLSSVDKPVLFGGILRRDVVLERIQETWQAAQRAIQHQNSQRESLGTRESQTSQSERGASLGANGETSDSDGLPASE